jgi:hypothetical protein
VFHFTLALIELAGEVVDAILWSALVPLAIVVTLAGGVFLVHRHRRR